MIGFEEIRPHIGFNAGGGIDVTIGSVGLRIDARYRRSSLSADSFQSIPLTLGIRF